MDYNYLRENDSFFEWHKYFPLDVQYVKYADSNPSVIAVGHKICRSERQTTRGGLLSEVPARVEHSEQRSVFVARSQAGMRESRCDQSSVRNTNDRHPGSETIRIHKNSHGN